MQTGNIEQFLTGLAINSSHACTLPSPAPHNGLLFLNECKWLQSTRKELTRLNSSLEKAFNGKRIEWTPTWRLGPILLWSIALHLQGVTAHVSLKFAQEITKVAKNRQVAIMESTAAGTWHEAIVTAAAAREQQVRGRGVTQCAKSS